MLHTHTTRLSSQPKHCAVPDYFRHSTFHGVTSVSPAQVRWIKWSWWLMPLLPWPLHPTPAVCSRRCTLMLLNSVCREFAHLGQDEHSSHVGWNRGRELRHSAVQWVHIFTSAAWREVCPTYSVTFVHSTTQTGKPSSNLFYYLLFMNPSHAPCVPDAQCKGSSCTIGFWWSQSQKVSSAKHDVHAWRQLRGRMSVPISGSHYDTELWWHQNEWKCSLNPWIFLILSSWLNSHRRWYDYLIHYFALNLLLSGAFYPPRGPLRWWHWKRKL